MELNINITEYLSKFKIHYPKSLLEPDFKMLKQFKCPICYRRLYWNVDRSIARCKSKQKDKFFIRSNVLEKLWK